jgi:hypothetical protein
MRQGDVSREHLGQIPGGRPMTIFLCIGLFVLLSILLRDQLSERMAHALTDFVTSIWWLIVILVLYYLFFYEK